MEQATIFGPVEPSFLTVDEEIGDSEAAGWAELEALCKPPGGVSVYRIGDEIPDSPAMLRARREAREEEVRQLDRDTIESCRQFAERERMARIEREASCRQIEPPSRHMTTQEMLAAMAKIRQANDARRTREREEWADFDALISSDILHESDADLEIDLGLDPLAPDVVPTSVPSVGQRDRTTVAAKAMSLSGFPKKQRARSTARDAKFYLCKARGSGAPTGEHHSVISLSSASFETEKPKHAKTLKPNRDTKSFPTWQDRHRDRLTPIKHRVPAASGCLSVYGQVQQAFDHLTLKGSIYAFTLNLSPKVEKRAYFERDVSRRQDTAAWCRDRLKHYLEDVGQSSEILVIAEEAPVSGYDRNGLRHRAKREAFGLPPSVRLHLHGFGVGAAGDEAVIRAAYRKAGGKQKSGWTYQCKLEFAPTDGWVGYCCKDVLRSSKFMRGIGEEAGDQCATFLGPMVAMTRKLSMGWQTRYNEQRAADSARRKPSRKKIASVAAAAEPLRNALGVVNDAAFDSAFKSSDDVRDLPGADPKGRAAAGVQITRSRKRKADCRCRGPQRRRHRQRHARA